MLLSSHTNYYKVDEPPLGALFVFKLSKRQLLVGYDLQSLRRTRRAKRASSLNERAACLIWPHSLHASKQRDLKEVFCNVRGVR